MPKLIPFPFECPPSSHSHPDWMTTLVESVSDITLRNLVIPGSHDSASYSIPSANLFSTIGRTQNTSIFEQLLQGIRFLDLRIASGSSCSSLFGTFKCNNSNSSHNNNRTCNDDVYIYHGCLKGCKFESVLKDICQFCKTFPREFLILHVVAEYDRPFPQTLKKKALDMIQSFLGDILFSEQEPNTIVTLLETPLKDVIREGAQVCVLLSRIYDNFTLEGVEYNDAFVSKEYNCFDSSRWLRDKWYNTRDSKQLLDGNLREVKAHNNNSNNNSRGVQPKNMLLNNQFVLTPGVGGFKDIVKLLLGRLSLRPVRLVNGLYKTQRSYHHHKQQQDQQQQQQEHEGVGGIPLLHGFFAQHSTEHWNLVSLDFIDLTPTIISLLIGLNFSPLEIMHAIVEFDEKTTEEETVVTSKVQSYVLRGKCLFLNNIGKDFGATTNNNNTEKSHSNNSMSMSLCGIMTLTYRILDRFYSVVIPFNNRSVILLNEYNHIRAGSKEIGIDEGGGPGRYEQ